MVNKDLEKNRVEQIVSLHNQIVADLKRSLDSAIQIGGLLVEQKKNLEHGQFGTWIESNLPFKQRTARNYMRCYRERDRLKTAMVADLKSAYELLAEQKEHNELTFWDVDSPCMYQSRSVIANCACGRSIFQPIKMDSLLAQHLSDRIELGDRVELMPCWAIPEIIEDRSKMSLADYREYLPVKIESLMEFGLFFDCLSKYHADEKGIYVSAEKKQELDSRAREHMENHKKLCERLGKMGENYLRPCLANGMTEGE